VPTGSKAEVIGMSQRPVKIGVLLARPAADLGEWLADAAALDAAGADALWLDPAGEDTDPLALTAALAAVTFRSLLVTAWPALAGAGDPAGHTRALATIERLSRGRLALVGQTAPLADLALFHEAGDGGFECPVAGGEPERWERTGLPEGRAAWRAAVAAAAERGLAGLLVPAGPQLLDLLRNPQGRGDRRDLQLAQG
jgi:hypothetical protein